MSAESFHKHVGVVCVIWCSGLLYVTAPVNLVLTLPPTMGLFTIS